MGDTTKIFHFKVSIKPELTGRYGNMDFIDGLAKVELMHGQTALADNLPIGTSYTITEDEFNKDEYRTSFEVNGTLGSDEKATGEILDQDQKDEVVFTNSKDLYGSLQVSKIAIGYDDYPESESQFEFKVTLEGQDSFNNTYEFEDNFQKRSSHFYS